MTQTICALFHTHAEALDAAKALHDDGIPEGEISVVASTLRDAQPNDSVSKSTSDADKGARAGEFRGGAVSIASGLDIMNIPGVGSVLAAGWLIATAVGAAASATFGSTASALIRAMTQNGIPESDAHIYAEGVRRGGALVTARVEDPDVTTALAVLGTGSIDISAREQAYRAEGWSGFDETAPAFDLEQGTAERVRYRT